jgi:hypothetical protein
MSKVFNCAGYWFDEPDRIYDVLISTGEWDGDENDNDIFYYTDGEPLSVGAVISDGFVLTEINEEV